MNSQTIFSIACPHVQRLTHPIKSVQSCLVVALSAAVLLHYTQAREQTPLHADTLPDDSLHRNRIVYTIDSLQHNTMPYTIDSLQHNTLPYTIDSLHQITFAYNADSTNRFVPSIESMLEDAGEDDIGAGTFIDEIEYYRTTSTHAPSGDNRRVIPSSPIPSNTNSIAQDSVPPFFIDTPYDSHQFFPLQTESDNYSIHATRVAMRSTIERDIAKPKGLRENKWSGSPVHSVQRIQVLHKQVAVGLLLEHDAGEIFSNGFIAGYAALHNVGIIDQIVAGTYTVNAGEGLVLARASLFSKGTMSITQTKKYGATLIPYLSRDEFNYFRGAAGTFHSGIGSMTVFFSHRVLPATTNDAGTVTSFYKSGLFRTTNEISKFNAVTERCGGLIATLTPLPTASITLSAVGGAYDRPVAASFPYAFEANKFSSIGIAFNAALTPLTVFGEVAGQGVRVLNGVLGTIYRASRTVAVAVHLRSYSSQYNNPFARAFSDRGGVHGEHGIYAGIDWNIARYIGMFAYVDRFTIEDPLVFNRTGVEYVSRLDGTMAKNFTYIVQIKYKTRSLITEPEDIIHAVVDDHQQTTLRFQVRYTSSNRYTLSQRCSFTHVDYTVLRQTEKGFLLATDIGKQYADIGLGWKTGIVFFDTDSYSSALSVYEPGVRGAASSSMLFGQGLRWFIVADAALSSGVHLSVKYGSLSKWNIETIGSGDEEILGNTDSRLTVQADIAL